MSGNTDLAGSVPGVPSARDIQVSPDNILEVARVIDEQAGLLEEKIAGHLAALRIQAPASDIVSTHAIEGWNHVVSGGENSYEHRVRAYVRGLRDLAEQLREASERYEFSDREKAESFGDRRVGES
ncbi:hypothetical protein B0I33_10562 [Prauserella shujinwangii]|uniref:PE family protein n=1 Tax=Prauserella shujinwangii TaxID=1453103 RepID=A0A2T0LUH7_9PSEU|nr:hypothetical protein [Prauserella shujinwangii]PRX47484.1 hypothetical protein B0I33_10562 [Prauserella shujinwangii]